MPRSPQPLANVIPWRPTQWTENLRWLWVSMPGSPASTNTTNQRSRIHRALTGRSGAGTSVPVAGGQYKGFTLEFTGQGACFLTWGSADVSINQDRFLGSVSAICSLRARVPGTGTNYSIGGSMDNSNGWELAFGGSNTVSFIAANVRETGTLLQSSMLRTDLTVGNFTTDVVGLQLNQATGTITVFQNGIAGTPASSGAKTFNSTDSLDFKIGGFAGDNSAQRLVGNMYWFAVFGACVPASVIQKWSWTPNIMDLVYPPHTYIPAYNPPPEDTSWIQPHLNFRYTSA